MRKIIILLILLLSHSVFALDLPDGWRFPTNKELSNSERDGSKDRYAKTSADYNGDGKIDEVYILVSTKFKGDGLFVCLSDAVSYKWIALDIDNWDKLYPNNNYQYRSPWMGVETLSPKETKINIKQAWIDSGDEEPNEEDYINPAIDYFKFGSAASLFYWSISEKKFKRFWYSD